MYYKVINDRTVFNDCKTIQMPNGVWVSNPTSVQIAESGWLPYVPPEEIPIPATEPEMLDIISAVKKMLQTSAAELSDEEALEVAALYPTWVSKIGEEVKVGERYWYNEDLYKVIQNHTVLENWTPDVSTSLFTKVSIEEYPEWVQPTGAQDAYNTGDKVTYNGKHYECLIDNNTWSPETYPAGWREV